MNKPISAALISVAGTMLSDGERRLIEQYRPLGVSLFARNIESRSQLAELTRQIREAAEDENIIIAVDQEGGRVRRLAEPEFRPYASQYVLGKIGETYGQEEAEKAVYEHVLLISKDLKDCGINMNFAPVLDLAFEETAAVLKSRCFGNDEKKTAAYGKIMVEGYIRNGICPCIKHMPGHGRVTTDPHLGLPILNQPLKELEKDFFPFGKLNHAPAGMTAHVVIPETDAVNPVTQSAKGIREIIRGRIGFDGLLISDAIDMNALSGKIGEKAQTCIAAGCDAVCYCGGDSEDAAEVCKRAGFMSDKSMIRFEKIKNIFQNNVYVADYEAVARDYESLTGRIEKYRDNYDATEVLNRMKQTRGE